MEKIEPKTFDEASKAMIQAHYDLSVQPIYNNINQSHVSLPGYTTKMFRHVPTHIQCQQQQMTSLIHSASPPMYNTPSIITPHPEPIAQVVHRPIDRNEYTMPLKPSPRKLSFDAPPHCPLPTFINQTKPPTVALKPNSSSKLPFLSFSFLN